MCKELQEHVFGYGATHAGNVYSRRVFAKLRDCHTAALGYHHYRCSEATCQHDHYQYHSCGDRHCMHCGGLAGKEWLEGKTAELLPTAYYHVVFTLPHELNSLIMAYRKELFNLLFEASSYTLLKLGKDPQYLGAQPGIISVLHTSGQQLSFHPHVHAIVSGGGIGEDGNWVKEKRKSNNFLFPKAVIRSIYKAYFLKRLRKMQKQGLIDCLGFEELVKQVGYKKWEVYAKKPFGGPGEVLEYLGRYTHKTAISKDRIKEVNIETKTVSFSYKDYREKDPTKLYKTMSLSITEFVRRFEQHILPYRYVRVRHYGYLQNRGRSERIKGLQDHFGIKNTGQKQKIELWVRVMELTGLDIRLCPKCQKGKLDLITSIRNPPPYKNSILNRLTIVEDST